ncbi:hypothetical protein BX666DRAFT_1958251 [Dichotomocladium elegans]|nr:hypothetical protein BX666DRAFT_1958251 [Dichotomocladium elegans]
MSVLESGAASHGGMEGLQRRNEQETDQAPPSHTSVLQTPTPPTQSSNSLMVPSTSASKSIASTRQQPSVTNRRQQRMNKFPTLHNEKYPSQLGRDLLLTSNFDRNLTVEKARFQTPHLITPVEEAPPVLNHGADESLLSSSAEGRYPNTFSSSASTSNTPYCNMNDRGSEVSVSSFFVCVS